MRTLKNEIYVTGFVKLCDDLHNVFILLFLVNVIFFSYFCEFLDIRFNTITGQIFKL